MQHVWVMPNSSARCAQLPRAVDKVPFYDALRKYRDFLKGDLDELNDEEVVFSQIKLKNFNEGNPLKKAMKAAIANAAAEAMAVQAAIRDGGFPAGAIDVGGEGGDGSPGGGAHIGDPGGALALAADLRIDPVTGKKRRGRPPKPRPDGSLPPPKRRVLDADGNPIPRGSNPIDPLTGKKKRGRPKKADLPPEVVAAQEAKKAEKKANKSQQLNKTGGPLNNSGSDLSINNKPTKIVPPLPPFSPNFGRKFDEEKPMDLKNHNYEVEQQQQQQQQQDSRLQNPAALNCAQDFRGQNDFPGNSGSSGQNYYTSPQHHPLHLQHKAPPPEFQAPAAAANGSSGSSTPNNSYHSAYPPGASTKTSNDDVTTKSITGLESLVDQIPQGQNAPPGAENDSGVFSASASAGSPSHHPNTPRSLGPYSPSTGFQGQSAAAAGYPGNSNSTSADSGLDSANSGSSAPPTDFSVNSLVQNTSSSPAPAAAGASSSTGGVSADPFSVSSLTSSANEFAAKSWPHHNQGAHAAAHPPHGGAYGSMFTHGFGAGGFNPMTSMAAGAAAMAYYNQYNQYGGFGAAPPGHPGSSATSSPYSSAAGHPGLHVPNPSYPYPSPYGQYSNFY